MEIQNRDPNKKNQTKNIHPEHQFENQEYSSSSSISDDHLFFLSLIFIEILGVVLIVLSIWWMLEIGGFDGLSPKTMFNYHPPLMTVGMIFLNANGILIYRSTRSMNYRTQKTIHLTLQTLMIVTSWLGFFASYFAYSHTHLKRPHLYSLHSWLGIAGLAGVTFSLFTSFGTFFYPKASSIYRKLSLPFHVFGGIVNLVLSAGVCVSGITEHALFTTKDKITKENIYRNLPPVAVLLNSFGVILVVFTLVVIWMVTKPEFRRKYKMTVNTPNFVLKRQNTIN